MELNFQGELDGLTDGLPVFEDMLDFRISPDGMPVAAAKSGNGKIEVEKSGGRVCIRYPEKIHFFRAVGLLVEKLRESGGDFKIAEEPQFTMNGAMIDISQGNAAINVESVKEILRRMSVMGLNMLMLYAEDSFEIQDEPYFGYMRPKYTYGEMKELDDYADMLGIEMIPCVQTLAHLTDALKWERFSGIKDDDDTLMVGEPETYELIEKIIRAASAPFRTRRIHIGMDEAWKLGQGNYLLKNGCRNKFDIMTEHLDRVIQICEKCGLEPIIWGDMFFRAASRNKDYYDKEAVIPQYVMDRIPKGVRLVYWDYYHDDPKDYEDFIERHRKFGSDPIFAGGIWNWRGFSVNYGYTFLSTNAALNACKSRGIKEVFATLWGDDAPEGNIFSNLLGLQLYAEHGYCKVLDEEKLKKRFAFCTGCKYEDFTAMSYLDEIPGCTPGNPGNINASKILMWQDLLMGLFDKNIEGHRLAEHYAKTERRMEESIPRNGKFGFLFEFLRDVCSVLAVKSEMGIEITKAYRNQDRAALKVFSESRLPELSGRVKVLRDFHRDLWMRVYKPIGWEIMDVRYGTLLARIDTVIFRLNEYLSDKIDAIEELD